MTSWTWTKRVSPPSGPMRYASMAGNPSGCVTSQGMSGSFEVAKCFASAT